MLGLATSVISAVGALLIAVAGYVFTKRKEREAEWRKEKLAYYKEFIESLSGTIAGETTPEGQVRFARACNNILLFAPYAVITALDRFHEEIRVSNAAKSLQKHDLLLSKLFLEIRKDIGVTPRDHSDAFQIHLRSSGVPVSGGSA
jgi:LPXTG-motif cell wall-anchored protein